MIADEAVRCRIQAILWDRFRKLICAPNHREGHLRWGATPRKQRDKNLGGG